LPARAAHPELSAFVLVQAVEGVVHAAIVGAQAFSEEDLVSELTELSLRYLTGRDAAGGATPVGASERAPRPGPR
jgi:hypothetical protein